MIGQHETALGRVNPQQLADVRLEVHYAVQWLTRAARALLPAAADDSHSNLGWDADAGAFITHPLPGNGEEFTVSLRVHDLTMWAGAGEGICLFNENNTDVGTWLSGELLSLTGEPVDLAIDLPYEMPAHDIASGGTFGMASAGAYLELSNWYAAAQRVLEPMVERASDVEPGPSPIRCWPHHFDIATLISFDTGDPETARSIGVGLSPGDESYGEPYFYLSPWPYPAADTQGSLPPPVTWHTEGFTAAVLRASEIIEADGDDIMMMTAIDTALTTVAQSLGIELG